MSLQGKIGHAVKNWKTSVAGVLSTLVSLSAAGFFAPNPFISTKLSGYIFAATGMARIALGMMQTDGSRVKVSLPDNTPVQVNLPPGSQVQQTTTIQTEEKH